MNSPEAKSEPGAGTPTIIKGPPGSRRVPVIIGAIALVVLLLGALMVARAASRVNRVALSSQPKEVTVRHRQGWHYRPVRRYVGTLEPWVRPSWAATHFPPMLAPCLCGRETPSSGAR